MQNKKTTVKVIAASIAAVLCVGTIFMTAISEHVEAAAKVTDATVQKYEDDIKKLEDEQNRILGELQSIRDDKADQIAYKTTLDQAVTSMQLKIDKLDNMLIELDKNITEKEAEIETKKAEIEDLKVKFAERVRFAYEEGDVSYIEMILGAESMSDFFSRIEWISNILEYDRMLSNQYKQEQADLEKAVEELNVSIQMQEEAKKNLESEKASYEKLAAECESYINALAADEAASLQAYQENQQKEAELDQQLANYLKELQEKQKKEYVGGVFGWPLPLSCNRISSYFGVRTLNGITESHGALDIPAPVNTAIYAANAGTVLKAEYHYSYGNYILIDHGGGQSTLYAHCNSISVSVGDTVSKGQQIGKVGTTGYSFGYHLHFEVRINGTRVDPLGYVNKP